MMNSQKKGWIRLHRKIEDNFLWSLEPFTKAQAWIDILLCANHKDGIMQIRGNVIPIKRGQLGFSELTLMKRWMWSKCRVRRFLKLLETEQQIIQQKDRFITTIITVLNYDRLQSDDKTIQQNIQQKDSRRYINNNVKKNKNVYIANPLVSTIRDYFYSSYKTKTGNDYIANYGKDGKLIKEIIGAVGDEAEIKALIDKFFSSTDKFIQESGYGVGVFKSQINKLRTNSKPQIRYE